MRHQDIAIERYEAATHPHLRVRIWLTERRGGRWGEVVRTRQISLGEEDLKAALRRAGLWERVEVSRAEETSVEADVAMFAALWQLPNPSERAKDARSALWQRLLRRMGV